MRKLLSIFFLLIASNLWALHIECIGNALEIHQGQDTILIFDGQPHLRSKVGNVDWYYIANHELIQANTDETEMIDVSIDHGIIVEKDGQILDVFYVFDYNDHRPNFTSFYAQLDCNQTIVQIDGVIPIMFYTDTLSQFHTVIREATIRYTNLTWGSEQWEDSTCLHTMNLQTGQVILPPIYGNTDFTLTWDKTWTEGLNISLDSIYTEVYEPVATRPHLTAEATIRGTEKENEVDRPIDKGNLTSISAPLEVLFRSNPTPAVRFYEWSIYHINDLLANRKDQDIRYTFTNPGTYRVVVKVHGDVCSQEVDPATPLYADSITVTIKESLLRVPNVFTPNGDGKNDEFRVLYRSLREYHIWVYNRWGKLVYESTDPSKGWDGMIGNRPAAEGAYYYVIRAMGTDAPKDASYHTKQNYEKVNSSDNPYIGIYQLSGDINLLRGKQ